MKKNEIDYKTYVELETTKDIQLLLKYIMKLFHNFCVDNSLIYNIFGGTMLGAVRHKGFIPWDDDIDVTMPRTDYNKIDKLLLNNDYLEVKSYNDKNYVYPYKKVCLKNTILIENLKKKYQLLGAYIDVFPADGYPDDIDYVEKKLANNKRKRLRKICIPDSKFSLIKKCYYYMKCIPYSFLNLKHNLIEENEILSLKRIEDSDKILLYGAGWGKKGLISKNIYFDRCLYDFEDIKVYGIKNYDEHLRRLYGEYKELPPIEQQRSNHDYHLYVDKKIWEEIKNE